MEYEVVIATCNRPNVLKVSIPLILMQDRPPLRLIIVDASDNHDEVRRAIANSIVGFSVDVKILRSHPNNALQRNIGIEHVSSPVVMFPDDDSLWWPGVAQGIMRIYERDKNGDIGGVCARPTKHPPPGIDLAENVGHKMRISDRVRQQIERVRHNFDNRFCPDPHWVHGKSRWNVRPMPDWLSNENAKLVEYMGGFRMSFRTEVLRQFGGFDEDLGRYVGWAACEDADASFKVLQKYLIVGAHNAKVFHYKSPNRRAGGFELGFITLFNRAYVISRYAPKGSVARSALKRFSIYKVMLYMLGTHTQFGRDRVRGCLLALRFINELLNTHSDCLRDRYLEFCKKALLQGGKDK